MARKSKRPDAVDMYNRERAMRRSQVSSVGLTFSGVASIKIQLSFEDPDGREGPESRELNYSPDSTAFFELDCPYHECIMGGFDFSAPVREAVRQRETVEGELSCPGWQDRERINKHGCYLKARYRVLVED